MAYALSLSGLLTTFRHHFVQRPHAQCKFNCFNPTARACLTRFNKIATQGAPQMAVDKEANSLSRVYSYYFKFNLRLFYV